LRDAHEELEQCERKIKVMLEHRDLVLQQLDHAAKLEKAKKQELETETHLKVMAIQEKDRLVHDINCLNKSLDEMRDRSGMYENNSYCRKQQLEQCRVQMKWNRQALEAWLEEATRKGEDAMIIQKYASHDDGKIKRLTADIERYSDIIRDKRHKLENEYTETLATQLEVDCMADELRRTHRERHELIEQLENLLVLMQKRDSEIKHMTDTLNDTRDQMLVEGRRCNEVEKFYQIEIDNNAQVRNNIETARRNMASDRQKLLSCEKEHRDLLPELDVLRHQVTTEDMKLQMTIVANAEIRKQTQVKSAKLLSLKRTVEDEHMKMKAFDEETASKEQRVKQMDKAIEREKLQQRRLTDFVDRALAKKHIFDNQLKDAHASVKNLDMENSGTCLHIVERGKFLKTLEKQIFLLDKVVYQQNLEMDRGKRRINRVKGMSASPEHLQLIQQEKALVAQLEQIQIRRKSLAKQRLKLQEDVNNMMFVVHQDSVKKANISSKMSDLDLHLDQADKQFRIDRHRKQDMLVEYNVVKLEVDFVRKCVYQTEEHLVTLEKQRLQLESAIKDRLELISAHRHRLMTQRRNVESERMRLSMELKDRLGQIDRLRTRYEMMLTSAGVSSENTSTSAVRLMVDYAFKREEMRRHGDELDAKLRKATIELHALSNTLGVVKQRNHIHRVGRDAKPTCEDLETLEKIKDESVKLAARSRLKHKELNELISDIKMMHETIENLNRREEEKKSELVIRQDKADKLSKEISAQEEKLQRSKEMNRRIAKRLRCGKTLCRPEEEEFEVRVLKEMGNNAIALLKEAMKSHPELAVSAQLYLNQAGIEVDSVSSGSSRSSRTTGVTGLLASRTSQTSTSCSASSLSSTSRSVSTVSSGKSGSWR